MKPLPLALGIAAAFALNAAAAEYKLHTWKKHHITPHFWAEGGHFGDFNHDGEGDVVVGPYWYAGPDFKKRHTIYPDKVPAKDSFEIIKDGQKVKVPGFKGELSGTNGYSGNFLTYTYDFNSDGWKDVLVFGWPGKETVWYENPKNKPGLWKAHVIFKVTDGESPSLKDVTGDGKPELLAFQGGHLGYGEADWSDPSREWKFVPISPKGKYQRYTHGYGAGDVNGDDRADILEKDGWWEQPAKITDQPWRFHKVPFSLLRGGAQMYTYDVNGNGRNDVITSWDGHGYGLAWYENQGKKKDGSVKFKEHVIINSKPEQSPYGVKFSQLHAIDLADIDGDGLLDIITGKRFWAHGPGKDAEPGEPAVLYWFELTRKGGKAEYIPHQIDDNSGVGTQVAAGDVNGDGLLDIVVGNKKGAFVHLHSVKKVSKKEWQAAQPKRIH